MKPSEYPKRLLKALVKGYDDPGNTKARVEGLDVVDILSIAGMGEMLKSYSKGDIETAEIYDALAQLKQQDYIRESGRNIGPLYKPTEKGLAYGRWLNKSPLGKCFSKYTFEHLYVLTVEGAVRALLKR